MFLKFHFVNTDGCIGTFGIAIFNGMNQLTDRNKIIIHRDDFRIDWPCTKGVFTATPPRLYHAQMD